MTMPKNNTPNELHGIFGIFDVSRSVVAASVRRISSHRIQIQFRPKNNDSNLGQLIRSVSSTTLCK